MAEFAKLQQRTQSSHLFQPARTVGMNSHNAPAEHSLEAQQQACGNQAMQRLLNAGVIQAKLTINEPGDPYEQEADRVAEQVIHMPAPRITGNRPVMGRSQGVSVQRMCPACEEELHRRPIETTVSERASRPRIQRMCPDCEKELHRQPMAEEEEEEILQAKEIAGRTPQVTRKTQAQINDLRGRGQPLPESVRTFFEPRFGYEFSQVRIHTDSQARESARAVNARAFTMGQNVVFGVGQYAPETMPGQQLLAHELTHTIQQTSGGTAGRMPAAHIQRTIGDDHDLQSPRFAGDLVLEECFDNERLLQFGATGAAVEKIQQALFDFGFPLPISMNSGKPDGIFGSETRAAVQDYQRAKGLEADGIVGPITMGDLDAQFLSPTPVPPIPPLPPCPPGTQPAVSAFLGGSFSSTSAAFPLPGITCQLRPSDPGKRCPTPSTSGVTGIHKAQQDFSGRSTTRIGVGEAVNLSFDSALSKGADPATKAVPHAGLKWVQTAGPGRLTLIDELAGTATFNADQDADTVVLELKVLVGPCAGSPVANVSFAVVKPIDGVMEQEPGTKIKHKQGTFSVAFLGRPFLRPTDVSFIAIEFREGATKAKAEGYLSELDGDPHPEGSLTSVGPGDSTKGSKVDAKDEVHIGPKGPPFSKGTFLWAIPWEFRVGDRTPEQFTIANQVATADANGKATIEKKTAGPFSRVPTDPTEDFI